MAKFLEPELFSYVYLFGGILTTDKLINLLEVLDEKAISGIGNNGLCLVRKRLFK